MNPQMAYQMLVSATNYLDVNAEHDGAAEVFAARQLMCIEHYETLEVSTEFADANVRRWLYIRSLLAARKTA